MVINQLHWSTLNHANQRYKQMKNYRLFINSIAFNQSIQCAPPSSKESSSSPLRILKAIHLNEWHLNQMISAALLTSHCSRLHTAVTSWGQVDCSRWVDTLLCSNELTPFSGSCILIVWFWFFIIIFIIITTKKVSHLSVSSIISVHPFRPLLSCAPFPLPNPCHQFELYLCNQHMFVTLFLAPQSQLPVHLPGIFFHCVYSKCYTGKCTDKCTGKCTDKCRGTCNSSPLIVRPFVHSDATSSPYGNYFFALIITHFIHHFVMMMMMMGMMRNTEVVFFKYRPVYPHHCYHHHKKQWLITHIILIIIY